MNERIYKFRMWNKEEKVMFLIGSNPNLTNYQQTIYELMQYTGLKDKNRKEIYEGDCFEIKSNSTEHKGNKIGIAWVIWNDSELGWRLSDNRESGEYNIYWFAKNCEIIGNIYENPELLN